MTLLLRGLVALFALTVVLAACGDDDGATGDSDAEETAKVRELREIHLSGPPSEDDRASLFSRPEASMRELLDRIDAARREPSAAGLFVRIDPMGGAWARVSDVRDALRAVRDAGKPVHCYLELADNASYLLAASSCDRISIAPGGMLDLVGPSAHVFYARHLLDTAGVSAELMQIGRFKGAADIATRSDMPPETRQSLGAILDDLYATLVDAISTGRRIPRARVRAAIEDGPYESARARRAALVDAVAYDDEARARAKQAARAERVATVQLRDDGEPMDLVSLVRALGGDKPSSPPEGARLALVRVGGDIVDGDGLGAGSVRSTPFVRAMRRFADDKNVKAVVIRIDSPGGSALASDLMWHAVRRVARRKPVIASLGDLAASGGYYIASGATVIVAQDTSFVGSIGVVGGKISVEQLATRAGVHVEVLGRGRRAGWLSPVRDFTPDQRHTLERSLRSAYDLFVSRVAEGRGMTLAQVQPAAEGRLMTGRRARELRLVDRAGGLRAAIALARERGGLGRSAPIEQWPPQRSLLDAIAEAVGAGPQDQARAFVRRLSAILGPLGEAMAVLPLLLGRERVVTALPFVLDVR